MNYTAFSTKFYIGRNQSGEVMVVYCANGSAPAADESNWTYRESISVTQFEEAMSKISNPDNTVTHSFGI